MSDHRSLDQLRAADALKKVRQIADSYDDAKQADYRSCISSLPATIVMNGLGQACGILSARAEGKRANESPDRALYDHVSSWLTESHELYPAPYPGGGDLLEALTSGPERPYLHAQAEALAWLDWAKKFAQAYLKRRKD